MIVMEMEDTSRDWSLLPSDLINKIVESYPLPHRTCFRMVCKSWCSAIPPLNIPSPWLLLPGEGPEYGEYTDSLTFYSILTNTTFKCPVPPGPNMSGMHCVGSIVTWLAMCDLYFKICLVNPMTGARIDLPPFTSNPSFKILYPEGSNVPSGFRDYGLDQEERGILRSFDRKNCYIQKIVFSDEPGGKDFMALALYGFGDIAFLKPNKDIWYRIPKLPTRNKVKDILYWGRKFWALTENAELITFDPYISKRRICKMPHDPIFNAHKLIAVGRDSKLYMILRNGDFQLHPDGKRKFHTRSLTIMKKPPGLSWDPVEDLDGFSMLIGNNQAVFLSPEEYPHLRRNCVYITGMRNKDEIFDMGVYDMEKKSFEMFYPPHLESNWAQPPPVWFEPSME